MCANQIITSLLYFHLILTKDTLPSLILNPADFSRVLTVFQTSNPTLKEFRFAIINIP